MSTSPENWFYVRDGRRQGPFDRGTLLRELLVLDAPEAALVWRRGLPGWTKVGLLDELSPEIPPPIPGSTSSPDLALPGLEAVAANATDGTESSELSSPAPLPSDPSPEGASPSPREGAGATAPAGEEGEGYVFDVATAANQLEAASAEERERRRRRRRRYRPPPLPRYVLPLVILFVAVVLGLWFLLRRVNEVPPGQIIQQGALSDSRPDALPG